MARKNKHNGMRAWILSLSVAGVVGGTVYFAGAGTPTTVAADSGITTAVTTTASGANTSTSSVATAAPATAASTKTTTTTTTKARKSRSS
jgi:hypothetical protein